MRVDLFLGSKKHYLIHRLVALAFVEGCSEERYQVNHKDEDYFNNHFSNLEWVTPKYNSSYGSRVRRVIDGEISLKSYPIAAFHPDGTLYKHFPLGPSSALRYLSPSRAKDLSYIRSGVSHIIAVLGTSRSAYGYRWAVCNQ